MIRTESRLDVVKEFGREGVGMACCRPLFDRSLPMRGPRSCVSPAQALGRNLESLVNRAMELRSKMGDQFVSIEHLVLAMAEDAHFGETLFKAEGLTKDKIEQVVTVACGCGSGARGKVLKARVGATTCRCMHSPAWCSQVSLAVHHFYMMMIMYVTHVKILPVSVSVKIWPVGTWLGCSASAVPTCCV
jgi:hypothetical protein